MRSLLKLYNYQICSVTTALGDRTNANIISWSMQSAMKNKAITIALDKDDYTLELVHQSKIFNLNILSTEQTKLINKLGRKSGRNTDKLKNVNYVLDKRGLPILTDSIGYIECTVLDTADSIDHIIITAHILKQKFLNKDKTPLTINYLREKNLIRG